MPRFYDSHNKGPCGRYAVPFSSHEIPKMFCLTSSHDPEDSKRIMLFGVRPDPSIKSYLNCRPPRLVRQGNIERIPLFITIVHLASIPNVPRLVRPHLGSGSFLITLLYGWPEKIKTPF
ncbi:UNVERIFIED_CONTAM: hypothetical protein Slati_1932100 [Sesamum latifolium]|uniref:Uncharacterized protein n=1 Tax=Sesamum latifolium TaxID=2727402 RepID=A0AAW2X1V5_9LAMI